VSRERVAVALSGGVDSAVAALLLGEAGYEVTGVHLRLWDSTHHEGQARQAQSICHVLNIPLHVLDLRREFETHVVDYFCHEYQRGRTPNPCVACNEHIKFGVLMDRTLSLGADYLATGHYVRVEHLGNAYHLLKARDVRKDQSYFLYTLSQERIKRLLFPLGSYAKGDVRQIAKQKALPIAAGSSQDICFLSQGNYRSFLSQRLRPVPGEIVDAGGRMLGHHEGIPFYTIGQRRGLGLASGKPLYVIGIEPENNRIVVGEDEELYSQRIVAKNVTWLSTDPPGDPIAVTAKIRYRSNEAAAIVSPTLCCEEGEPVSHIWFPQSQRAISPGQAVVFYQRDEVLGGGIIERSAQATLGKKRYVGTAELRRGE
jgi:tRNA-specific 2-thiouridylase